MIRRKSAASGVLAPLCAGLCAGLQLVCAGPAAALPPAQPVGTPLTAADGAYRAAASAINRRDYPAALENLQLALARRPDEARTLNGFGVVYDKLGRFDLSARYYALAQAADPQSPIIAQNKAYSALLQAQAAKARAATPNFKASRAP